MKGTPEALQEWIETFPVEWRRERRQAYMRSLLEEIGDRLAASEHRFNMKYDPDYRKSFFVAQREDIREELRVFYEFSDDQVRQGRPAVWRLTVYGLEKIAQKERKLKWLDKMINGKSGKGELTDEMVEQARDYPIEKLIGDVGRGNMIKCPIHDDKNPSMYVKSGYAYCFSCNKQLDSIGWLMEVEGMSFVDAVKSLSG